MLRAARALKPYHICIIGDLADFFSISTHSKDPKRAVRLDEELLDVNIALDELDALGAVNKQFVEGNHEDRLRRYLEDQAPELINQVATDKLFQLKERGWQFTSYKQHTRVGKLYTTHDVGTAGRYATYKALDIYQHSVVTGHTHRMSYVVEGNAVGEFKLSASFGWLGDHSKVDYMHRVNVDKNWALGFGFGYIHQDTGIAYLTPVPIIQVEGKYTCVVNGVLYEDQACSKSSRKGNLKIAA